MIQEAYENGVLDERVHRRLVAKLPEYAARAGIPPEAICTHLLDYAEDQESDWVGEFLGLRENPPVGLAYVGPWRDARKRMTGLTGCLVRNFVDARMMLPHQIAGDEDSSCSVLLIPTFSETSNSMPGWMVARLVDQVLARISSGKTTVLHVEDLPLLKAEYGVEIYGAIRNEFKRFTA